MTDLPLVFVSYSHDDRNKVKPLVHRFRKRKWRVWWDRETRIGAQWRNVIEDQLRHAGCVVVVWTRSSVKSDWVVEEAQDAAERGVLVPLRLDRVRPPLGLRAFQYADLADWKGGAHEELNRLVKSVSALLNGGIVTESWSPLEQFTSQARSGVDQAEDIIQRVRAQSTMYKRNPSATKALNEALGAISATYRIVTASVKKFLAPIEKDVELGVRRYRPFADGALIVDIQEERGHCTELAEKYIAEGGLRDNLPEDIPDEVIKDLDQLFRDLSEADGDLFQAMASVGDAMTHESAVLVNLLTGKQKKAARERLEKADRGLAPFIRELNAAKAKLNRVAGELGLSV